MKECERYRDYFLRRSDLVIKFKKILCQKYLDSEEIYRLSESIMLIDSLLSRPPPLLSSSSSSLHYLLSSSSGAVASLLSLCVSPKRMLRPLLLIWMCTAVRGALESLCPDIEKSKFFVVDPCENGKYCEKPILKKDDKNVIVCNEDMEKIEGRNGKKNAKWNKIKELKCFSGFLIATLEDGNSKNFDYLQFRCIAVECQADARKDCKNEDKETCEKVIIENKSKLTCSPGHQLEVEQSPKQWTEINPDPEKFPYIRCVGDKIECKPVYKVTKLSQANFRCRPTACTVSTQEAFNKITSDCMTNPTILTNDICKKAEINGGKSKLECGDGFALEMKTSDERWTEVVDNECKRSTLTFTRSDGKPITAGSWIGYRCRKLRGCDVKNYFVKSNDFKEQSVPLESDDYYCLQSSGELQASFTNNILWKKIDEVTCISKDRFQVKNDLNIPMALRCYKKAVCGVDVSVYKKKCEPDNCAAPEIGETSIFCNSKKFTLEFQENVNYPWKLFPQSMDCYKTTLIYPTIGPKEIFGNFRCRSKRKGDMTKYFDDTDCKTDKQKRCEKPVLIPGDGKYRCPQVEFKDKWTFKGMLAGTNVWIDKDIISAEFRKTDGEFVITELKNGVEKVNEYIPIKFVCIRDATCEAENKKYTYEDTDCPKQPPHKDTCEKSIYEKNDKKTIVCEDTAKVLEYQEDGKPWKELKEIGCIGEKMTRTDAAGTSVAVNPTRIRCREPRGCDMAKYYDDENCGGYGGDTPLCTKLLDDLTCKNDYDLQYKSLKEDSWKKSAKIKCDTYPSSASPRIGFDDNDIAKQEEIPISFRCSLNRKCKVEYYYVKKDCETEDICDEPKLQGDLFLRCPDDKQTLRVKSTDGDNNKWQVVESIKCNVDKFDVLYDGGKKFNEFPHQIQCVRMRRTTCKNPGIDSGKFEEATTWNGTTTVHCKTSSEKFVIGDVNKWNHHTHLGLNCLGTLEGKSDEKWAPIETDPELDELRKRKGILTKVCPYDKDKDDNNLLTTACMSAEKVKCEKSSQCEQSLVCETCIKAGDQTNAMVIGCEEKKDIMIYDAIKREKVPYENNTAKFLCERGIWQTETGDYFDNAPRIFCVGCADVCKNCTKIPNMRNAIGCDNETQVASVKKNEFENTIHTNQTFVCKYGKWLKMTGEPLVGDDVGDKLRIDCIPKSMDPNNKKDEIKGNGETNQTWLWLVIAIIVIALIVGAVVGVVFMRRKKNAPAVVPEEPKEDDLYSIRFDPIVGGPSDGLSRMMKRNKKTGEEVCVNEECIPAKNIEIKEEPLKIGGVTFNHHPADHKMANQTDGDTVVKVTINNKPEAVFIGEGAEQVLPDSIDTSEIENAPNLNEEEEKQWKAIDDRMTVLNNIMLNDDTPKEEKDACAAEYKKIKKDNAKLMQKKSQYHYSAGLRDNDRRIAEEKKKDEARKKAKESPSSGGSSGNKKKKETSKKRK